jgi:hypothetical protein
MFSILDSGIDGVSSLVYNALVFTLGILLDEKRHTSGYNLRPVLNSYLNTHFCGTLAHTHLLKCLKQTIDESDNKAQVSKITATLKVSHCCSFANDHQFTVFRLWNILSNLLFLLAFYIIANTKVLKMCGSRKTYKISSKALIILWPKLGQNIEEFKQALLKTSDISSLNC